MSRRLTLLCAPAGFGKTTLLSEWRISEEWNNRPVAWLSLDAGDNDPVRFWGYFFAALETLRPGVRENAQALLRSSPTEPIEVVLTALINNLADFGEDFALVLDDYHMIDGDAIHHGLSFLLEHLPPRMHLAIAGRSAPPLALARLRASDQLSELGAGDFRLSLDEAAVFLNKVMALGLTSQEVAALEAHTEGWMVGLHLAALSIRGARDTSGLVKSFTGSNRYVVDYLGEEVLQRQPEDARRFLLQTCILQRMCGPLCDALTAGSNGRATLEMLDRANLLVVPLDNERRWYRYHPLFAEFLQGQLRRTDVDGRLEQELHRRATDWHWQNGFVSEAIEHSLRSGDFERSTALIEETAAAMLIRGEVMALLGWLELLPEALVRARPRLGVFHAWALVMAVRFDPVDERLRDVEASLHESRSGLLTGAERQGLMGEVAAIRAMAANFRRDISATITLCNQALQRLPDDNYFVRGICAQNLGIAYHTSGEESAAIPAFLEAVRIGRASNNIVLLQLATTFLARCYERQGKLHRAAEHFRQAIKLLSSQGWPLIYAGFAHIGLASVLRQWNFLKEAKQHLETAIELGERWPNVEMLVEGYISLARLLKTQRDYDAALASIEKAEDLVLRYDLGHFRCLIAAVRVQLCLATGDIPSAEHWAGECLSSTSNRTGCSTEPAYIERARVLVAQGNADGAISLLDGLLPTAKEAGRAGRVIEIMSLHALASASKGKISSATDVLRRALALAEPEGFVRTFGDKGPPMALLLSRITAEDPRERASQLPAVSPKYVRKLLAAFEDGLAARESKVRSSAPLAEPLSKRELEVLQMICEGLSNDEIATRLVVAVSTVKSHNNSIFAKMAVKHRTQAVAVARELNLIGRQLA